MRQGQHASIHMCQALFAVVDLYLSSTSVVSNYAISVAAASIKKLTEVDVPAADGGIGRDVHVAMHRSADMPRHHRSTQ